MQAEHWKTVKDVLFEVLNLEPARQNEYLNRMKLTPEVREEVASLLAVSAASEAFMSLSPVDLSVDFIHPDASAAALAGQRVGNYEIIKEIGFGGMGAVYLAERRDGVLEQQAAIKMLKREFNTCRFREFFRREKEIQAKLNHPNIARLLDAGMTGDGVPFLVMEYIEGEPIDKFCAKNNLPIKDRLKIFNRVCDAVAYAHRNLTVHRDLKPSNIIVNEKGEPKLLDFGIAKLLDAQNADTDATPTIFAAMTPEYASPEQIRGEAVTTATDVYSLGAVLYKTLTGALPFDFKNHSHSEIIRVVSETAPTAPSAISHLRSKSSNPENPKSEIRNSNSLKGDLDNIILKALDKEPERRYQSVEQFSADIWRYIDGLPVAARPATITYRAAKYVERNKFAALSFALIAISLIGGTAAALWQAKKANAQANFALNAQRQAEAEEEKAKKISDFMSQIIAYANPQWYTSGAKFKGETKVIEALDELGGQIDAKFANEPDVQAELHHKFAEVYNFRVGKANREKERFHAARALESRRQFYGDTHELIAKDLFYFWVSLSLDDPRQAETLMSAIEMMRQTNPKNLNLPYMLTAYAARLTIPAELNTADAMPSQVENEVRIPAAEEIHKLYRCAFSPATGEDNFQIAEKLLREAMPLYRFYYREDNAAIAQNECELSYVLAARGERTDFAEHFTICKQGAVFFSKGDSAIYRKRIELIEKILAENSRASVFR